MLPTQGDPLVAIEELFNDLESRLEDHLKVYQASSREKDAAIASLREELDQLRNDLLQTAVEAEHQREMYLNVLRSTEDKLNKKMKTLTQTMYDSNSENQKQRGSLSKAKLDVHTLQVHATCQAQKLRRVRTAQIELQQAVEELKSLPGALRELEAEQAKLYELSHSCTPHPAYPHRTLSDELGALPSTPTKFSLHETLSTEVTPQEIPHSDIFTVIANYDVEAACISKTAGQDSDLLTHLPVNSKIKEAISQIHLYVRVLCIEVSHRYQTAFSSTPFTSFTYYLKQRVDSGQLPLLLASTVLSALLLGRTLRIFRAEALHTTRQQYWSPGDGFVVQPL